MLGFSKAELRLREHIHILGNLIQWKFSKINLCEDHLRSSTLKVPSCAYDWTSNWLKSEIKNKLYLRGVVLLDTGSSSL
jgi:hypothetical protein